MSQPCRPLRDVLAEMADARQARGKRHTLPALLTLVCVATLCGYRSYSAMAEWGRHYGAELMGALGFTHPTPPCAATLHRVLRRIDRGAFAAAVRAWAQEVLTRVPGPVATPRAVAIGGKTPRGSRQQGAPDAHLLAAVSQRLGLPLAQQAVADKTNEITTMQTVLRGLVLEVQVYTMDALLTQRPIATQIVEGGDHYVMVVKENQPQLWADIATLFADPALAVAPAQQAQTLEKGHGRIERRSLRSSTSLVGYSDWPGLQQVFELQRRIVCPRAWLCRHETVYGVTSLPPIQADAACLLRLASQHWHIENRTHWVRGVTFDEDRSQVRCGTIPRVLATTRTTAISLLRGAGEANIAAACRRCAAQPWRAFALIGLHPTMK